MCTTGVNTCLEVYAFQVKSKKQGKEPMVLVQTGTHPPPDNSAVPRVPESSFNDHESCATNERSKNQHPSGSSLQPQRAKQLQLQ